MQPEVLAWALLFVVGVGLAYRFGFWFTRHSERTDGGLDAPPPPPETSAAPSEPIAEIRRPKAASVPAPTPPPSRPVNIHPSITPPMPVPSAAFAAATPIVERVLKPALVPDVRATLAPVALVVPSPATEVHATDTRPPEREHITIRKRGTWLRARKMGREIPSLNARIKDTRGPTTRSTGVPRKPAAFARKRIKPLAAPKGLEKAGSASSLKTAIRSHRPKRQPKSSGHPNAGHAYASPPHGSARTRFISKNAMFCARRCRRSTPYPQHSTYAQRRKRWRWFVTRESVQFPPAEVLRDCGVGHVQICGTRTVVGLHACRSP
jgi:hypothetical protein